MIRFENNALDILKQRKPKLAVYERGLPDTGFSTSEADPIMRRIDDAYRRGNKVYSMDWQIAEDLYPYNLGNGSPLKWNPFPCAVQDVASLLETNKLSQYAYAAGDAGCRSRVADYLYRKGLRSNTSDGYILPSQLIFFHSTTEAFSVLMSLICTPGDVVLFTAPTYGLFAYAPERVSAHARFLPLREEDQWLPNAALLEETITQINTSLPTGNRVVAFFNMNPHNPTGRVLSRQHYPLLVDICEVCKRNGVFLVDDIIYWDLCYNATEEALPAACIPGAFEYTITLFGTSKSYGLAGARAGAIFADEVVIRGLRNKIFQQMDSTSLITSYLMAGAFQSSPERDAAYQTYFSELIQAYRENWSLVQLMICGQSNCSQIPGENAMRCFFEEFAEEAHEVLEHGLPPLSFAGDLMPESGFFALIDFSGLIGKRSQKTGQLILDEMDVIYHFYRTANIKLLTGGSFAWPIPQQIVSRVSFAYSIPELLRAFHQIKKAMEELI